MDSTKKKKKRGRAFSNCAAIISFKLCLLFNRYETRPLHRGEWSVIIRDSTNLAFSAVRRHPHVITQITARVWNAAI
jgi:hypothetical protein